MAEVDLSIGGRRYSIVCRDGGEDHLRTLASHVDRKVKEATAAVGSVNETRQLLFAALLLADEMAEAARTPVDIPAPLTPAEPDPRVGRALAVIAHRMEALADALETRSKAS